MITDTLQEERSISQDLHPLLLEKFGLTPDIKDALDKIQMSTNLFITQKTESIDKKILTGKAVINIF